MQTTTHAVGIDLGTTYSCISYLNEHGKPVTLTNQEGELSTPSAVLFDGSEVIIGTEALRNAIAQAGNVIQNSKRYIGDEDHSWTIDGKQYTPVDIASFILKKMLDSAVDRIGKIESAVITVPAQFGDAQRRATIEAGHRAGLKKVELINEPVAAALCYVLGSEGMWFTELAEEQCIMVYDLGGGTFDLSLVKYHADEVRVIASTGDLKLGGIDWTAVLEDHAAKKFASEFKEDPRKDPQSLQYLSLEAEQAKRSLSVRSKTTITCQHGGHRCSYDVDQETFEALARPLVDRTASITTQLLKDNGMGWAHVDAVLVTGGSSRMPMIRRQLKQLSGTTSNTELSPDQSIAHGATYYAGMLLTNDKFARSILNEEATERLSSMQQHSVTARALGILVRKSGTKERTPNYLIKANSALPVQETRDFGTVVENQKRVHLQIVESGPVKSAMPRKIGDCTIYDLPEDLPEGSKIAVTISYDKQARVHVSALDKASGRQASIEIVRQQNVVSPDEFQREQAQLKAKQGQKKRSQPTAKSKSADTAKSVAPKKTSQSQPQVVETKPAEPDGIDFLAEDSVPILHDPTVPVPLCNGCGETLDIAGRCPVCPPPEKPVPINPVAVNPIEPAVVKRDDNQPAEDGELPMWDMNSDEFWGLLDD